jgi:hypothetical protein
MRVGLALCRCRDMASVRSGASRFGSKEHGCPAIGSKAIAVCRKRAAQPDRFRQRNLLVRALVRREDERATALRATGAEVVIGDLTRAADVARALAGCRRMYFGMSASALYLEATVTAAAVAREHRDLEVFVNISQLTVSQMSLTEMTDSPQQLSGLCDTSKLGLNSLPTRLREQRSASFALGVNLSPPTGCYGISAWVSTAWFAHDSALEQSGFELSVPPCNQLSSENQLRSSREMTMGAFPAAVPFTAGPGVRIHLPPAGESANF